MKVFLDHIVCFNQKPVLVPYLQLSCSPPALLLIPALYDRNIILSINEVFVCVPTQAK